MSPEPWVRSGLLKSSTCCLGSSCESIGTRTHDLCTTVVFIDDEQDCSVPGDLFPESLHSCNTSAAAHIEVRHHTNHIFAYGAHEHTVCLEARDQLCRAPPSREFEDHNVGLHSIQVDLNTFHVRECLGKQPRIRVIFMQPSGPVLKRNQSRRGQHTRLPHSPTQCLAEDSRPIHLLRCSHQHRPHWRAQSFRQAKHYRVEPARQGLHIRAQRHGSIEDSCAIQVYGELALRCACPYLFRNS